MWCIITYVFWHTLCTRCNNVYIEFQNKYIVCFCNKSVFLALVDLIIKFINDDQNDYWMFTIKWYITSRHKLYTGSPRINGHFVLKLTSYCQFIFLSFFSQGPIANLGVHVFATKKEVYRRCFKFCEWIWECIFFVKCWAYISKWHNEMYTPL